MKFVKIPRIKFDLCNYISFYTSQENSKSGFCFSFLFKCFIKNKHHYTIQKCDEICAKSCKCDKNRVQNLVYHKQKTIMCVESENWASSTSYIIE